MGPICFPSLYEGNVALVETRPILLYEQDISYVQNRKVFSVHRNPSTYVDEAEEISLTRQNLYITIKSSWVQRSLQGLSFCILSFPYNLFLNKSIYGSGSSSQMISQQCGLGLQEITSREKKKKKVYIKKKKKKKKKNKVNKK